MTDKYPYMFRFRQWLALFLMAGCVAAATAGELHRKIVVVGDDNGMARSIRRLLKANGYETAIFESAESALKAGASGDCFVLDINLPGMSGADLQVAISLRDGDAPVVLITADDRPAMRERARLSGTPYLVKPFPSGALLEAINKVSARDLTPGSGAHHVV